MDKEQRTTEIYTSEMSEDPDLHNVGEIHEIYDTGEMPHLYSGKDLADDPNRHNVERFETDAEEIEIAVGACTEIEYNPDNHNVGTSRRFYEEPENHNVVQNHGAEEQLDIASDYPSVAYGDPNKHNVGYCSDPGKEYNMMPEIDITKQTNANPLMHNIGTEVEVLENPTDAYVAGMCEHLNGDPMMHNVDYVEA